MYIYIYTYIHMYPFIHRVYIIKLKDALRMPPPAVPEALHRREPAPMFRERPKEALALVGLGS